jgi:hypothetical protein
VVTSSIANTTNLYGRSLEEHFFKSLFNNNRPTQRAPDVWDSLPFLSISLGFEFFLLSNTVVSICVTAQPACPADREKLGLRREARLNPQSVGAALIKPGVPIHQSNDPHDQFPRMVFTVADPPGAETVKAACSPANTPPAQIRNPSCRGGRITRGG